MRRPLEPFQPGDPYHDFCHWSYEPPRPPASTALAGANLLFAVAEEAGCLEPIEQDCARAAPTSRRL